jgi:hypothetical protein
VALLSKTEVQFLQDQKRASKSYEYKLKSIIKKKLSKLFEKELALLAKHFTGFNNPVVPANYILGHTSMFSFDDLTKNSKMSEHKAVKRGSNLTESSKELFKQASKNNVKAPGPGFEPGSRE